MEPKPLILLVDDSDDIRLILTSVLAHDFRLAEATDGQDGLAQARQLRPDLIITDMRMPGGSGLKMIEAIRQLPELRQLPIVVNSALYDPESRSQLLATGPGTVIFEQSLTRDKLVPFIRKLLSRPASSGPPLAGDASKD